MQLGGLIGWVLILLFVPETKALTLEELDQVFSVPTWRTFELPAQECYVAFQDICVETEP